MVIVLTFSCQLSFNPRWYFAVISVSGVFAVTFSVVFAYVADITQEHERSMAYGLVCTFILIPLSAEKHSILSLITRSTAFALQDYFCINTFYKNHPSDHIKAFFQYKSHVSSAVFIQ